MKDPPLFAKTLVTSYKLDSRLITYINNAFSNDRFVLKSYFYFCNPKKIYPHSKRLIVTPMPSLSELLSFVKNAFF